MEDDDGVGDDREGVKAVKNRGKSTKHLPGHVGWPLKIRNHLTKYQSIGHYV